ncbi:MAG TPA: hypothetical protein VIJ94_09160, partial [Caulobacteraceae bacterium]
ALGSAGIAKATPSYPAHAAGDWAGAIESEGAAKHIFVHIHKTLSGGYVGTMDSPEGGDRNVPIRPIGAIDDSFAFAAGDAVFRGKWDATRGQWRGIWTEAGASWPVSLRQDVDNATSPRLIRKPE